MTFLNLVAQANFTWSANVEFQWGAMVLAALAAFFLGFLWYGPIFGRRWGEEMGFDMDAERPGMKEMLLPMAGNLVGNFLIAYTLTWILGSLGSFWTGGSGFYPVLMVSLMIWGGFYLPTGLSQVGWEQRTWGFFGINMGFHFLNLVLIGTLLAYIPF